MYVLAIGLATLPEKRERKYTLRLQQGISRLIGKFMHNGDSKKEKKKKIRIALF